MLSWGDIERATGIKPTIAFIEDDTLEQQNADLVAALREIAETDIEFPYDVVKDMQWAASSALAKVKEE